MDCSGASTCARHVFRARTKRAVKTRANTETEAVRMYARTSWGMRPSDYLTSSISSGSTVSASAKACAMQPIINSQEPPRPAHRRHPTQCHSMMRGDSHETMDNPATAAVTATSVGCKTLFGCFRRKSRVPAA